MRVFRGLPCPGAAAQMADAKPPDPDGVEILMKKSVVSLLRHGGALAVALWLLPAGMASASEPTSGSMRCGTHLVYVGDPKYEVLNRCGEPDSASLVGERLQRLAVPYGPLRYSTESLVPVEEWIYERGYGRFIRILTFEGDTLERIRLGPRK